MSEQDEQLQDDVPHVFVQAGLASAAAETGPAATAEDAAEDED